ncbi:MAG: lipoyl synthase [Elusimicrobia bacterium]|nr:lipoyl synthase [Elusimicrobiota bacterium]
MMAVTTRAPFPPWLRVKPPSGENYVRLKNLMAEFNLNSVCEEARCPNVSECWSGGTATFMVMGDACTRGCRFCSVESLARPASLDPDEPSHLAQALGRMGLNYAVLTSVCRDDLPDQGAGHIARCIREVKASAPAMLLEFLIPDFRGDRDCLKTVVEAGADVLAHNLETVRRLTHPVRDRRAGYEQSLDVLKAIKSMDSAIVTKSSLMLGLGETEDELLECFADLRATGVEILTLGQYLRPTGGGRHLPVLEYVPPERFDELKKKAENMGFLYVASGPFVRSSYKAAEFFLEGYLKKNSAD